MFFPLILSAVLGIQAPDSTAVNADNRNVMLNAESANKPRVINIGFATGDAGTVVMEDGMLMNYVDYPIYQYHHWAGGNAYASRSLMPVEDAVVYMGHMKAMVDSYSKLGGEKTGGTISLTGSSFGQLKVDAQIGGPLARGWYFSAAAYVNKDPGSTMQAFPFSNDMEVYKGALTKRWKGAELSLLYKFSDNRDRGSASFIGPFIYVGDGSVKQFQNFKLGTDNYFPEDDSISFIDGYTGKPFSTTMYGDDNRKLTHDVTLTFDMDDFHGWKLRSGLHACICPDFKDMAISGNGMLEIKDGKNSAGKDVTYADGSPFSGYMQTRTAHFKQDDCLDITGRVVLNRVFGSHDLTVGIDDLLDKQFLHTSSAQFAHTAEADPVRLLLDGVSSWNFNRSTVYIDGVSNDLCAFAMDKWAVTNRFSLQAGLRMGWNHYDVLCAVNLDGKTNNSRHNGFYILSDEVERVPIHKNGLNMAALLKADWNVTGNLYASGEFMQTVRNRLMVHYFTATVPNQKPLMARLSRAGLQWSGEHMDISSSLSYAESLNGNSNTNASKEVNGNMESSMYLAMASYGTLGFTTEANIHSGGFALHLLCTLQDARYTDYKATVTFSDGDFTMDYTGKQYPGLSRVLLEIDPSYKSGKWRVWSSLRYMGPQYVNKSNTVKFDGHWETFAGVRYSMSDKCDLALNLVNLLNAKGAKGTISAADTIGKDIDLRGYILSGTYIIPFNANLGMTYRF